MAIAQRGFMNSSGHRSNLLSDYDRFGCAAAIASDSSVYYTCVFSRGGPSSVVSDAVLPRVTGESGRGGSFARGHARTFYANLSDNVGLRSGNVYLDGVRLRTWMFDGSPRSVRVSIAISASRLRVRPPHPGLARRRHGRARLDLHRRHGPLPGVLIGDPGSPGGRPASRIRRPDQ